MTTYRLNSGRSTAAGVVNLVGTVLALILVTNIVCTLTHADPTNRFVAWVHGSADVVGLWFTHLIDTGNASFSLILNYGLAAVFWLVVTGIVASLLRSVG